MSSPFDGLRPPRPSHELRARVLDAALAARAEAPHWVDRLWESRGFRFALAVTFAVVIAGQLMMRDLPAPRVTSADVVELDGLTVLVDRFESNDPLPLEAAQ